MLIVMFCWKKEAGQKLALIVSCVNLWLPMIKSVVLRSRPYMEYPDRVKPLALSDEGAAAMDVAAQGYSFPSMHSASIPAVCFWLAKEARTIPGGFRMKDGHYENKCPYYRELQ